jgi:hypothetical protein
MLTSAKTSLTKGRFLPSADRLLPFFVASLRIALESVLVLRRSSRSFFLISLTVSSPSSSHLTDAEPEDKREIPDAVDGGRSEDELEMVDEGRRDVKRLRLIVELTDVRLMVPVGWRSSLESVVDEVVVETAERTVPKRREDGRPRPRTLCFLPIVLGALSSGGTSNDTFGIQALLIVPTSKLLVDVLTVPSFFSLVSFLLFLLFFFSAPSSFSFLVSFPSALGWDQLVSLAMDLIARRAMEPEPETSRSTGGARRPGAGVVDRPSIGEAGRCSGSMWSWGDSKVCEEFVPNE